MFALVSHVAYHPVNKNRRPCPVLSHCRGESPFQPLDLAIAQQRFKLIPAAEGRCVQTDDGLFPEELGGLLLDPCISDLMITGATDVYADRDGVKQRIPLTTPGRFRLSQCQGTRSEAYEIRPLLQGRQVVSAVSHRHAQLQTLYQGRTQPNWPRKPGLMPLAFGVQWRAYRWHLVP